MADNDNQLDDDGQSDDVNTYGFDPLLWQDPIFGPIIRTRIEEEWSKNFAQGFTEGFLKVFAASFAQSFAEGSAEMRAKNLEALRTALHFIIIIINERFPTLRSEIWDAKLPKHREGFEALLAKITTTSDEKVARWLLGLPKVE